MGLAQAFSDRLPDECQMTEGRAKMGLEQAFSDRQRIDSALLVAAR